MVHLAGLEMEAVAVAGSDLVEETCMWLEVEMELFDLVGEDQMCAEEACCVSGTTQKGLHEPALGMVHIDLGLELEMEGKIQGSC
jgi:hypothetical protein